MDEFEGWFQTGSIRVLSAAGLATGYTTLIRFYKLLNERIQKNNRMMASGYSLTGSATPKFS